MKRTNRITLALVAAVSLLVLGRCSTGWGGEAPDPHAGHDHAGGTADAAAEPTLWTCPMHPQIKLPDAGDCPICGMDLVPMTKGGDDAPRQLAMSPAAKELARIETARVMRHNVTRPVRMVGKVDYDETAVRTISAWVPGRLDRLFVDYTGVHVNKGDHLVELYSPSLLTAQDELLGAKRRLSATAGEASEFLATSNRQAYEGAREKLHLWGLTEEQILAVEARGTAEDTVTLTSPSTGVVTAKLLDQGAYVQTGSQIYRIADLSKLWVRLDAYEQDLAWLRYGQDVVVEVEALPGETFTGQVSYIDPFIHEHTRTAKVRVNVDNADGRLKPGMFVRAVASVRLGAGAEVLDRALAGKWISPMHPEIVKDAPGTCDICGMDLVSAESLGLVSELDASAQRPLVVPSTAVLVTGKRAVVYVEVPGAERPTYEGREVTLGPRAGDEYIVRSGLEEGERVVVQGAFRIDSSMQIKAKPSMMSMPGESASMQGPEATLAREALAALFEGYLALQVALASDDEVAARTELAGLGATLADVASASLPRGKRSLWNEERERLAAGLERARASTDLAELRVGFGVASDSILALARAFGSATPEPLFEAFCPMAFDNAGASWLQVGDTVANPYFGASMLRCGELRQEFVGTSGARNESALTDEQQHDHEMVAAPSKTAAGGDPLVGVFRAYLTVQSGLAGDAADEAHGGIGELLPAVLAAAGASGLDPVVAKHLHAMHSSLLKVESARDLEPLRAAFHALSQDLLAIDDLVGNPLDVQLRVVHCPMAFDNTGADWLQSESSVLNPYFGASMLRCGSVTRLSPVQ